MKTLLVLCVLAVAVQYAVCHHDHLRCYFCTNPHGNCKENETTCTSEFDRCTKITNKNKGVIKSCSNEDACEAAKTRCGQTDKCDVSCCEGDLCNASVNMKPLTLVIILAPVIAYFFKN